MSLARTLYTPLVYRTVGARYTGRSNANDRGFGSIGSRLEADGVCMTPTAMDDMRRQHDRPQYQFRRAATPESPYTAAAAAAMGAVRRCTKSGES